MCRVYLHKQLLNSTCETYYEGGEIGSTDVDSESRSRTVANGQRLRNWSLTLQQKSDTSFEEESMREDLFMKANAND